MSMTAKTARSGRVWVWVLPVLALVAGIALGAATTLPSYQPPVLNLPGHVAQSSKPPAAMLIDAKPRVDLPEPTQHDFGIMARGEEQSHVFKVRNIGNGPLTLKVLDTTCKCTVGELGDDSIKSGETADVKLTWVARSYDREFRQSATIETNDQTTREIVFSVYGQVKQLAMPDLPLVNFSRLSRSDTQKFETIVYAYRDEDLSITSWDFSNEDIASFFSVTTSAYPREQWQDEDATGAIKVQVEIKPGLPLGANKQIIALNTNKIDIAPMDVAIDISIISDISVLGARQFDDEHNILRLGPIPRTEGREFPLFLLVKGQYRDQVKFSVAEIDPDGTLTAEIGEPTSISSGRTIRVPLMIRIPPNSAPVRRMGTKQGEMGRIVFDTQHPEIKQFDIRVQFAVQ